VPCSEAASVGTLRGMSNSAEAAGEWIDVGAAADLAARELQQVMVGRTRVALSCVEGRFAAINGVCNHVGGPLGEGRLDGDYVVCPWHHWKFHRATGEGEPGYEADRVPRHEVKVEGGRVFVSAEPTTKRGKLPHPPHRLARPVVRESGPIRVLGLSTTAMEKGHPRYSTSEDLLEHALAVARESRGCETDSSSCATSSSATARASTARPRAPAPGRARSRRWTRATSSSVSTKRSCTGPT